ncbi:unnamed protein product [Rangifer tarandus platyrhynchus]|uniref:Uncharacterized protein n=1 Tax=Rangifer tarandus platyrhynchus TaxID=3082113 RepID=A0ABN8ZEP1_RANTA|nr:unnamed protein product [Rangifer tarandus platyrhynchus]
MPFPSFFFQSLLPGHLLQYGRQGEPWGEAEVVEDLGWAWLSSVGRRAPGPLLAPPPTQHPQPGFLESYYSPCISHSSLALGTQNAHMPAQSCPTLRDPMNWVPQGSVMGFSSQEYWRTLPSLVPGDLPVPGIEPASFGCPALAGYHCTSWEARNSKYMAFKSTPAPQKVNFMSCSISHSIVPVMTL